MSRSNITLLTVALCGAAVLVGQSLLGWPVLAATGSTAIPDLHGIDALQFSGRGDVRIVTATAPGLTITNAGRSDIKVTREGTTLVIAVRGWFGGTPTFVLQTTPLRSLDLSGSVELETDQLVGKDVRIAASGSTEATIDKVVAPAVAIRTSGSTELTIEALTADRLDVVSSGSSEINVKGRALAQNAYFSGSVDYDALGLVSERVTLVLSGSTEAKVRAERQLHVQGSGGGELEYAGNPVVEQQTSGSFELRRTSG